jgi:hypothetical protein
VGAVVGMPDLFAFGDYTVRAVYGRILLITHTANEETAQLYHGDTRTSRQDPTLGTGFGCGVARP